MHGLETVAEALNLPEEKVQKESLKALLETQIHSISAQLGTVCRKHGAATYEDLDRLIQEGKVSETQALDDFQLADHLEARIRRLKKILFDQIDS